MPVTLGVGAQQQETPRFTDRVDVARILIDARVLDDHGNPIAGLAADDFKVKIDGKIARVESATWIGGRAADADAALPPMTTPLARDADNLSQGRLIVFLFQKDLEPSRIFGLMRMLLKSRRLLDTLTSNDRIAILSFDSRLRIWTDFTNDRERLDRVLRMTSCSRDRPNLLSRPSLRWWSTSSPTACDTHTASSARLN